MLLFFCVGIAWLIQPHRCRWVSACCINILIDSGGSQYVAASHCSRVISSIFIIKESGMNDISEGCNGSSVKVTRYCALCGEPTSHLLISTDKIECCECGKIAVLYA